MMIICGIKHVLRVVMFIGDCFRNKKENHLTLLAYLQMEQPFENIRIHISRK